MRPWLLLSLVGVSACEDKGIGLPCQLEGQASLDGGTAPVTTQVIPQAVECPESICIQMAKRDSTAGGVAQPQAYCTARCGSNSDCEGGENCWLQDPVDPTKRVRLPFVCVKPIVIATEASGKEAAGGGLSCEGLCICEADARIQDNPRVMVPDDTCDEGMLQLCEDWEVRDPPQCVEASE